MGLGGRESGFGAARAAGRVKITGDDGAIKVALAGNPNVGKSTLFNALTGLNQHTGNWAGKTVSTASGRISTERGEYLLVDIPGTYSLYASSVEEEVASDFICFGGAELTVVVCDATCLERSLGLAIGAMEVSERVLVVVNLLDEAHRCGLKIDTGALSDALGVPVIGVVAKSKKTLTNLRSVIDEAVASEPKCRYVGYEPEIETAAERLASALMSHSGRNGERDMSICRHLAIRMLSGARMGEQVSEHLGFDPFADPAVFEVYSEVSKELQEKGYDSSRISDSVAGSILSESRTAASAAVSGSASFRRDRGIDRILTGRWTAFPIMLLFLFAIIYITVSLANYPSALLAMLFGRLGTWLRQGLAAINTPLWLRGALMDGIYTVLAEVVSVMLPPMAIFFPLFTLLEDSGYLPRVAYNLDRPFRCAGACGKQALTMCMGLGCNAAGIVGCRIIDSPRERRLAIVTNSLMPCNGRFPTIILLGGILISAGGIVGGIATAFTLTVTILIGIGATFLVTFILSRTVYRGEPSFFTLELPPFRRPDIVRVLMRSFLDRTVYVLGRAVTVAVPAGLIIWLLATVRVGDVSLLLTISRLLDPIGRLMGMDGVILTAFILGLPANEIVLPIAVIGYTSLGLGEALALGDVAAVLTEAGWTPLTALSVILFSVMHWPCSTSLISIYKETRSLSTTALAAAVPTILGFTLCVVLNLVF